MILTDTEVHDVICDLMKVRRAPATSRVLRQLEEAYGRATARERDGDYGRLIECDVRVKHTGSQARDGHSHGRAALPPHLRTRKQEA